MSRCAFGPLLLAFLLLGCSFWPTQEIPEEDEVEARLGESFELSLDQAARFTDAPLRIRFDEVSEDSRCPADVVCVWAGRAIVTLHVDDGIGEPAHVAVALPPESLRTPEHDRYRITLESLDPYPTTQQPTEPSAYRARLVVERR